MANASPAPEAQDRRNRRITIAPIAGALGAELLGVDLAQPLDDETVAEIRQALFDHQVIFFRDQDITPEQHIAFGRRFGPLNIHPQYEPLAGHPEILPIVKEPQDKLNIGGTWHSDVSFLEHPSYGSILYGIDVPECGGDTLFASQYLAWESLSDGMRETLGRMRAVHSDRTLSDPVEAAKRNAERSTKIRIEAMTTDVVENLHPVGRTIPETGRRCLYVNRPFTLRFEDMTEAESKPLLEFLFEHAVRPEFTCRFRWEKGSIAFWDNRCVQHFALNDYPGHRRYMHRVTVEGERPI